MMAITAADVKALRDRTGRGDDGLQSGPRRGRGRRRPGDRDPPGQGPGLRRQARGPRHRGGRRRLLHPRQRQGRGDGRSPVRDRLRRPQRGLQGVRLRGRPARRRDGAELRLLGGDPRGGARGRKRRSSRRRRGRKASPTTSSRRSSRASSSKWAKEVALLDQAHVNAEKHDSKSIEELRQELAAKTGENIRVARFAYFRVGA